MKIWIKNVDIVPMTKKDLVLKDHHIIIEDGEIRDILSKEPQGSFDQIIDGHNRVVIPGLINTHTHLGMSLLRNYADDMNLKDWLEKKVWPFEAKLTADDIYYGSKISMMEMIASGTTAFVDMYFEMDRVYQAARETGMRGVLTPGFIEDDRVDERIENIKKLHDLVKDDPMIDLMVAPHAPYTVGRKALVRLSDLAAELGVGMHIHLSETRREVEEAMAQFKASPIAYVDSLGLFQHRIIAAHCVHVSDHDIEILADKGVYVAHNPSSNLKLASGFAPIEQMKRSGVAVCLGTDGASSNNNLNMMEEMHMASLLGKALVEDPTAMSAYETLEMATCLGAKAIGRDDLGSIETGKRADLVLIDTDRLHWLPQHNLISSLVYTAQGADVRTVLIDGAVVYHEGAFTLIDEEEVKAGVLERTRRLIS